MDLVLQQVSKRRRIHSALSTAEFVLDVSESDKEQNVICLSKWEKEGEGDFRLDGPVCQWEKVQGEFFGTCAVVDSRRGLVYASLKDRRRFVTLQVPEKSKHSLVDEGVKELELESPLFSLAVLPGASVLEHGDLVVAVSTTGELAMICATGPVSEVEKRILDPLPVDSILAVTCFQGDYLVVVGLRNREVVLFPIHFKAGESFSTISVEQLDAMQLPKPPKSVVRSKATCKSFILDFVFDEKYIAVLYAGGLVHILRPQHSLNRSFDNGTRKLGCWYEDSVRGASKDTIIISKPDHIFQLSPGLADDNALSMSKTRKGLQEDAGAITVLDENYFAIGYGQYVSIWDSAYNVGHGLVQIDGRVAVVCPGRCRVKPLIGTDAGLEELSVGDTDGSTPFSLGLAINRKGACDTIVTDLQRASEAVPMRAQPVTVAATRIAAEAEGDANRVFRLRLESLDEEEVVLVRKLLNRSETSLPEAVAKLTKDYTTEFKKVRRGNRGKYSDMGLAKLPSERLAAVSVARCLYEIQDGNPKFLVPLIDMIGTGVVSSEAVLAVMGTSDSWSMGPDSEPLALLSIVDPLMTSGIFMNALEAVVARVADLPEPDIVRVVQFVVRLTHEEFSNDVEMRKDPAVSQAGTGKSNRLAQATNLLLKSVSSAVDRTRVIESLRQIPIADVIAMLNRFDDILNAAAATSEVKKRAKIPQAPFSMRDGFFFKDSAFFDEEEVAKYRGVGDWLDNDEDRNVLRRKSIVSGCIEWTSHLIDAHLANLIMDETGQEVAARLLKTVRVRRGEFEVIKSLHGLTSHLIDGKPVPSRNDPLYTSTVLEVPSYASLQ